MSATTNPIVANPNGNVSTLNDSNGNVVGLLGPGGEEAGEAVFGSQRVLSLDSFYLSKLNKHPGQVAVDWSACSLGAVTANWSVEVDNAVTYCGLPTLKISGTAASVATLNVTITLPAALHLGSAKRYTCFIKSSDRQIIGDNTQTAQIRFNYSAGGIQTVQAYTTASSWDGSDWVSGTAYDGDANTTGHTSNPTVWAKVDSEETSSIALVMGAPSTPGTFTVWLSPFLTDPICPPVLSIFMDGNYASQYTYLRQALARANIRASLAIDVPRIGSSASYMTLAQIGKMYDAGHECVRHTGAGAALGWDNTTKYPDVSVYADVKADCDAYRTWAVANGFTRGVGYGVIGWTNGMVKTQTLARRNSIAQAVYDSGERHVRTLTTAVSTYDSHFEHTDHSPLFKNPGLQILATTTQGNVDTFIAGLKARGGWNSITFHTAVLSGGSGNDINASVLDTVMSSIVTEVAAGTIVCLPFSEAMEEIALPSLVGV